MVKHSVGRLVDITKDGETVRARVIDCDSVNTSLKVVPNGTKD